MEVARTQHRLHGRTRPVGKLHNIDLRAEGHPAHHIGVHARRARFVLVVAIRAACRSEERMGTT